MLYYVSWVCYSVGAFELGGTTYNDCEHAPQRFLRQKCKFTCLLGVGIDDNMVEQPFTMNAARMQLTGHDQLAQGPRNEGLQIPWHRAGSGSHVT